MNWNPNDNYVVTSITSFDDGAAVNPDDGSGTLDQAVGSVFSVEAEQLTQDLRIASNLDGPFDFVADLYYYREELTNAATTPSRTVSTHNFAGADDIPVLGTINGGSADPLATIPGQDFSDSEVTGRIGLDYAAPNGTLFYGSFQQGYRGGAFNAQAYYDPSEISVAEPEFLDSFEVGFKSTLWDGRIRPNGAAFSYSYEGQQFISIDVFSRTWRLAGQFRPVFQRSFPLFCGAWQDSPRREACRQRAGGH